MTPLPEVLPSAIATASGDDGGGPRGDDQLLDFLGEFTRAFGRSHLVRRRCYYRVDADAVYFLVVIPKYWCLNWFVSRAVLASFDLFVGVLYAD